MPDILLYIHNMYTYFTYFHMDDFKKKILFYDKILHCIVKYWERLIQN